MLNNFEIDPNTRQCPATDDSLYRRRRPQTSKKYMPIILSPDLECAFSL